MLTDSELKALADDPKKFLAKPSNRGKALGISDQDLKKQLEDFARKNNIDPQAFVKELVKEVIR